MTPNDTPTTATSAFTATSTRDVFAAFALQGLLSAHSGETALPDPADAARQAREYADALLSELHDNPFC